MGENGNSVGMETYAQEVSKIIGQLMIQNHFAQRQIQELKEQIASFEKSEPMEEPF